MDNDTKMDPFEETVVDPHKSRQRLPKRDASRQETIILTVMSGGEVDFGKTFAFDRGRIRIGRDKSCEVTLDDPKVSKIHCEIDLFQTDEMEQIVIRDLDSTNGLFVGGKRVKQRMLKSGDKIELGDTVLRFNHNDEVEEQYHSRLFTFASTDSLTGIFNKRYILNELHNQIKVARRNRRVFSIILLDLDHFKKVNDRCGHLVGDEVLRKVAVALSLNLREQDSAGRFGGEEFLIILPETAAEGARNLAERIRRKIEETEMSIQDQTLKITLSAGVAQYDHHTGDVKSILKNADNALYRAKMEGRNRVVCANVKSKE